MTAYKTGGDPKTPILLVLSLGDEANTVRQVLAFIQANYRPIASGLPGFGHNEKVKREITALNRSDPHFCGPPDCGCDVLAGATGIAPSASKFGGTDFQLRLGLERLLIRAFWRDFCFLKGLLPVRAILHRVV